MVIHRLHVGRVPAGVIGFILADWNLLTLIDASPYTEFFNHHVIGERTLSPMLSLALFQTGWLLMSVAMMLPSTLPTLARIQHHNVAFWVVGYLAVLLVAGIYQFTPWKTYSLSACRKQFRDARDRWDAMALGWLYGLTCVGNCWALMLVMATLGTMNLAHMLLLGTFIAAEKSLRWRRKLACSLGAALVSAASVMLLRTLRIV